MSPSDLTHPEWLPAIAAAVGLACAGVGVARALRRRRREKLVRGALPGTPLTSDLAPLFALLAIGAALLGPRIGEQMVRVPATGQDLALLIDVSRSMAAEDAGGQTRLAAAQRVARDALASLGSEDRAALVIFASRGVVLAPLTPDTEALAEYVDALGTRTITPAGSRLAVGIEAALEVFEPDAARPRTLLLLSDGEDPEAAPTLGIAAARRAEARVVSVAFGSEAGAHVRDGGIALRDADDALVVSRRDARRLERVADATGGVAIASDAAGRIDTPALVAALGGGEANEARAWTTRKVTRVPVLPLAALALALLTLELIPPLRARLAPRVAALAAATVVLVAAGPSEPDEEIARLEAALRDAPGDATQLIALGVARLERGDAAAGRRALREATATADAPGLAALAHYDLGVAALEAGALEEAREAFFAALALAPDDDEARFNLAWTLEALRNAPAPQAPEPPPESQRPETPQPRDAREPGDAPAPAMLDEASQRRMLRQVHDDLERAIRNASQREAPERRRRAPAW